MFYLRKISKESNTESNVALGKNYVVENENSFNGDFMAQKKKVLDWMRNDKEALNSVFALVYDTTGRAIPIFHSSHNYIVTENGNTYAKIV